MTETNEAAPKPITIIRTLESMGAEIATLRLARYQGMPPVELLHELALLRYHMAELQTYLVKQCKAENVPWDAVGEALGMEVTEANLRYL